MVDGFHADTLPAGEGLALKADDGKRRENRKDELHRAVDTIEALGLVRPPHLTLRRFLTILVDHGLASAPTVGLFLEAHDELSFAAAGTNLPEPTEIGDRLVLEVTRSVETSPTAFNDLVGALQQPPAGSMSARRQLDPPEEPGTLTAIAVATPDEADGPNSPDEQHPAQATGNDAPLNPLQLKLGRNARGILGTLLLFSGRAPL